MASTSRSTSRVWYERTIIAVMVIVGFAVGSFGLTVLAEVTGDDPVLTDEFSAPVAEDPPTLVTVPTTTVPPSTTTTTTTTTAPEVENERGDERAPRRPRDEPRSRRDRR